MKKFLLFLFFTHLVYSQNNTSFFKKTSFNSSNGYNITNPEAAVYDDLGFLWIVGNNFQKSQFNFGEKELIIQRFDGLSFYDFDIPDETSELVGANLIKNKQKLLLFVFYETGSKLYEIDPFSLDFRIIEDYDRLQSQSIISRGAFTVNNELIWLFATKSEVQFYTLKEDQFVITDSTSKFLQDFLIPQHVFNSSSNYTLLHLGDYLNYLVNAEGKIVKFITHDDFDDGRKDVPRYLNFAFQKNGISYFSEFNNGAYYRLNEQNFKFEKIEQSVRVKVLLYSWNGSSNNLFVFLEKKPFNYDLNVFDIKKEGPSLITKGSIQVDGFNVIAYKNLDKGLAVLYDNTIEVIQFNQSPIQTFLKGESVRALRELKKNSYLVSTDKKGFYKLNTTNNKEEKVYFKDKNEEYQVLFPRDIIKYKGNYFLNDRDFILELNDQLEVVNKYNNEKLFEEVIKVGDTLFKGGLHFGGLLKFDLKTKTFHKAKHADFMVREFATNQEKLYAVTVIRGLAEYNKGKVSFFIPPNEAPENLLSIVYDPYYGLLITTKYGKIYSFDTKTKSFTIFYEDRFKASVVGVVSDTTSVLWLNTYAGIVSYDPRNKLEKRYLKKDGVYELEGNRYSTYLDSQGKIFMGSFRGLSVFNPYELNEKDLQLKLQLASVSYFDTKANSWQTKRAPNYLEQLKELSLPAHSQRFSVKAAILNDVDFKDYRFRYRLIKKNSQEEIKWNKLFLENEIVFSNLSAGEYTLELEVLNFLNQKVGKGLILNVISNQIFYKTWWFFSLIFFTLVLIVFYLLKQFREKEKLYIANKIAINQARIKEAMMLEIHHRIKNNLQVVSGLLSLQAFNSDNLELKAKLKDSQSRIESIAGIHTILYNSDDKETVLVADHLKRIIDYNKTLFPIQVKYNTQIDHVKLRMEKAIPLALIVNELINNSHKHAFSHQDFPEIHISFRENVDSYLFSYSDNGNFIENNGKKESIGMKIVKMMSSQLKGNDKMEIAESFGYRLEFPK